MERRIRLLIVDDEIPFLEAIARRLQMRDFEVTRAGNGPEAIAAARNQRFDLALLDLKMPEMDGREVLEILRSEHRFLEVIILTGHGSLDSAVECTKLGAFDYLPKPYEFEKLVTVLKEAYQHRLEMKFQNDQKRMEQLMEASTGESPLGILRKLRELDDERK